MRIGNRFSNDEVIERLKLGIRHPCDLVDRVVEEAADARTSQPSSLGLDVQDLPE